VIAKNLRRMIVLLFGLAILLPAGIAQAQSVPSNDDFGAATSISTLPFADSADTTAATAASDDPTACGNNGSVWYTFTPSQNEAITASTIGSDYDTVLSVYTGARGALGLVTCNDDSGGGFQSQVIFSATAGTTYFFMISTCCGTGGTGGGQLTFNVSGSPPPANDNFSSATQISALPFSDTVDTTDATVEPGEPTSSCPGAGPPVGSVWYSLTPATSESVTASSQSSFFSELAAYTGASVGHLTPIGCTTSGFGGGLAIHVDAGTTYYFQAARDGAGPGGQLTFTIDVTPAPQAFFQLVPSDPSIFDTVQFLDGSFDPAGIGIHSEAWNFGDGTTGAGTNPTHQYAADKDYTVTLTITTTDGRTATTSQLIPVSTHDVTITAFKVPASARPGNTGSITVAVSNKRYPETVQVQLRKGNVQGGFDPIATMTLPVPVMTGKHITTFTFRYTFTQGDASVGKVTFEAVATIQGARDALPADNVRIATTSLR
jgi:hypothetical protein